MASLEGHGFVVTGAAGGIGSACARSLAVRGADLMLTDVHVNAVAELAESLAGEGRVVRARHLDVTCPEECSDVAAAAAAVLPSFAGAVLSAGSAQQARIQEVGPEQWRAIIDVHLTGTFFPLQAFARVLKSGASIVCISSTTGEAGGPARQAHYVAAKAGTLGLVRAAARELGPDGIRVNAVSPGFTDTGFNDGLFSPAEVQQRVERCPLGRVARPHDIAEVVAFLLGGEAAFVTGENVHVDGGTRLA